MEAVLGNVDDHRVARSPSDARGAEGTKGNAEREGFEPSIRVTPDTAFPGLRSGVQAREHPGISYSEQPPLGHREACEGTRAGTPLGLATVCARRVRSGSSRPAPGDAALSRCSKSASAPSKRRLPT